MSIEIKSANSVPNNVTRIKKKMKWPVFFGPIKSALNASNNIRLVNRFLADIIKKYPLKNTNLFYS